MNDSTAGATCVPVTGERAGEHVRITVGDVSTTVTIGNTLRFAARLLRINANGGVCSAPGVQVITRTAPSIYAAADDGHIIVFIPVDPGGPVIIEPEEIGRVVDGLVDATGVDVDDPGQFDAALLSAS